MVCVYQCFQIRFCRLKIARIVLCVDNSHGFPADVTDHIPRTVALTGGGFYAPAFLDRNARFLQLRQKPRRDNIVRHLYSGIAKKFLVHISHFRIWQDTYRLDPPRKKHLALHAGSLTYLPSYCTGMPRMPANAILCAVRMVPGGHLTYRHFTFHGHKVVTGICAAELIVDYKIGRVHIRVIRRR